MPWSDEFIQAITAQLTEQELVDPIVKRLFLMAGRGQEAAQQYLRSECDKWMHLPKLVPVFERMVFEAGESGLEKRTPWNGERLFRAGGMKLTPPLK